ncbi:MAG: hypothetical protein WD069_16165, partial [Planctomycetales bacterium]
HQMLGDTARLQQASRRATFSKAIADIKADFVALEGTVTADEPAAETEKLEGKGLYAPAAEVMSAWADVESLCQRLLEKNGVHVPGPYRALGSRLKRNQLIDPEHAAILDKLRQIRNIAAHGGPDIVSACEAREYIALAGRMMTYLNRQLGAEWTKERKEMDQSGG